MRFVHVLRAIQRSCFRERNPEIMLQRSCLREHNPEIMLQRSCLRERNPEIMPQRSCLRERNPEIMPQRAQSRDHADTMHYTTQYIITCYLLVGHGGDRLDVLCNLILIFTNVSVLKYQMKWWKLKSRVHHQCTFSQTMRWMDEKSMEREERTCRGQVMQQQESPDWAANLQLV